MTDKKRHLDYDNNDEENYGLRRLPAAKNVFINLILIRVFLIFSESPVSVKMRIRHYFSTLALNNSASYDVRQGFDKQFDLIEDYDRRCQTLQHPPR